MSQIDETLKVRGDSYGDFREMAEFAQTLKAMVINNKMDAVQKEAMEMILLKVARISIGDPNHIDSWHDIGGYAKLVENDMLRRPIPKAPVHPTRLMKAPPMPPELKLGVDGYPSGQWNPAG